MRLVAGLGMIGLLAAQDLRQAVSALEGGQLEEAESTLSTLVGRSPDDPDANYYLGLTYFREDRPREARPYLQRAARLSPANPAPWKALGLALLKTNEYPAAAAALGKACELNAGDEDSCYLLGRSLFVLGRYDEAVAPFDTALHAVPAPNRSAAHRAAALNFAELGRTQEAERNFLEAIRLYRAGPAAQPDPKIDYGAFLIGQGRALQALDPLRKAASDAPASARANAELGRALLDLDRPQEAVVPLANALNLDPNPWSVRLLLGRAYLRLGRKEEGERELRLGREGWAKQDHGSSKVR